MRSFLGLANYLKRFIPDYSSLTHPLRELTKKDKPFEWSEQCENSFQAIKTALTETSCVTYFDEKKETLVFCDASTVGISSILLQKTKGKHDTKVIAYTFIIKN